MAERPSALLDHLARATTRVNVVDRALHGADTVFPAEYEISGEDVLAELFALLAVDEDAEPFCCMCRGDLDLVMYDRAARQLHGFQLHRPVGADNSVTCAELRLQGHDVITSRVCASPAPHAWGS